MANETTPTTVETSCCRGFPFHVVFDNVIVVVLSAPHEVGGSQKFLTPETVRENGYKILALRILGSFGWASDTYDWLMVALNTIDQS